MTRKDFVALASALRSTQPRVPTDLQNTSQVCMYESEARVWNATVKAIADACAARNTGVGFKRETFYDACGYAPR